MKDDWFDKVFPWIFVGLFVLIAGFILATFGVYVYILLHAGDIGDFILKLFGRVP